MLSQFRSMEPAFRTVLCRAFYPDCRCRKFDLGLGIGYRQMAFDQFKCKLSHRLSFIDEGNEILRRSWTGEPVNFSGKSLRSVPYELFQPHRPIRKYTMVAWQKPLFGVP